LEHGWQVHGIDRTECPIAGVKSHKCDVTNESQLLAVAEGIGPIDALVPAAGINLRPSDNSAEKLTMEAWDRTIAVNLTGVNMLQAKAPSSH
jgi:NAD(P)-dependent dehydrogenase (short-subunit alcohol dehydrogenase family)